MPSINFNPAAVTAQNNIGRYNIALGNDMARLSTGNSIINPMDDVSGLAVGTKLKVEVDGLRTVSSIIKQADALISVADGAASSIGNILERMKSLAMQAKSAALDSTARGYLNQEFTSLRSEADRIANTANFNGIKLLDGTFVGTESALRQAATDLEEYNTTHTFTDLLDAAGAVVITGANVGGTSLAANAAAEAAGYLFSNISMTMTGATTATVKLSVVDPADGSIKTYSGTIADVEAVAPADTALVATNGGAGAFEFTLGAALANAHAHQDFYNDFASAINAAMTTGQQFQVGTASTDTITVAISSLRSAALNLDALALTTTGQADTAVTSVQSAIDTVTTRRASLGAYQSRFNSAAESVDVAILNQDAARGVFLDADVAKTSSKMSENTVRINMSVAVLAQANQINQSFLRLVQ